MLGPAIPTMLKALPELNYKNYEEVQQRGTKGLRKRGYEEVKLRRGITKRYFVDDIKSGGRHVLENQFFQLYLIRWLTNIWTDRQRTRFPHPFVQ